MAATTSTTSTDELGSGKLWDVIVVGAGPVGLTLAINLVRQGLSVRVIDKNVGPAPMNLSKASVLHTRSMEVLEEMGCVDEILRGGVRGSGVRMHHQGSLILSASFSSDAVQKTNTQYPFAFFIIQGKTEEAMRHRLAALGGEIEYGVELTDLTQAQDYVVLKLRHVSTGQEEVCKTKYLGGCDGAHSTVRHKLGIGFQGELYQENLVLGDFEIEWEYKNEHVNVFLSDRFIIAVFPLLASSNPNEKQRVRLVINELDSQFVDYTHQASKQDEQKPTHGGIAQDEPTIELYTQYLEQVAPNAKISNPTWTTRFRISHRNAGKYNVGRAFICGDAAHIHSPLGGLGMNTGIQDAYNLAWKLGLVLTSRSPHSLLSLYEPERHPVAQSVLSMTDQLTKVIFVKSEFLQKLRNQVLSLMGMFTGGQGAFQLSGLGVSYGQSSIVRQDSGALGWGTKVGIRIMDANVANGKRLYHFTHGYKHAVVLFCSNDDQFQKSFDHVERIALQLTQRYTVRRNVLKVFIAIPHGKSVEFSGDVIQDGQENELYTTFEVGSVPELYVVRPDGYIAYYSKPADADKVLQYLTGIFI